jgi:Uncharacterized protein conserved in bacteria, putative lipoprotein
MSSPKFLVSDTLSLSNYPFSWLLILFLYVSSSLYQRQMYSQRVWCYSCHTTPDLLLLTLMSLLTDAADISSSKYHTAQETAICHNPHNSPYWDFCIARQLVYKHTFCQNVVPPPPPKKTLVLIFLQKQNILTC